MLNNKLYKVLLYNKKDKEILNCYIKLINA